MNVLRLEETMLINKVEFLEKTVFFLVRPETYWVMCYASRKQHEIDATKYNYQNLNACCNKTCLQ